MSTETKKVDAFDAKRYIRDWTPDNVRDYVAALEQLVNASNEAKGALKVAARATSKARGDRRHRYESAINDIDAALALVGYGA